MLYGAGLSVHSAAFDIHDHIKFAQGIRSLEGSLDHSLAQLILWQHAKDRLANYLVRPGCEYFTSFDLSQSSRILGVPPVNFLVQFLAGELDLLCIHNDDMFAAHEKRGILGPVLS